VREEQLLGTLAQMPTDNDALNRLIDFYWWNGMPTRGITYLNRAQLLLTPRTIVLPRTCPAMWFISITGENSPKSGNLCRFSHLSLDK
jgi:hypothetical protein